jgi:hypothetical protein
MTDFRIVVLTVDYPLPQEKEWLLADSEMQCEYCQALAQILLARTAPCFTRVATQ